MARRSKKNIEAGLCAAGTHPWITGQAQCTECRAERVALIDRAAMAARSAARYGCDDPECTDHPEPRRGAIAAPPEQRFASKIKMPEPHMRVRGCWEWLGGLTRDGYGTFEGTTAHRWSYQHHVGPIPDGLEIDHVCRNRSCVNPWHLEPVTASENQRRRHMDAADHYRLNPATEWMARA